ncbi:hypothetical protein GCM10007966_04790 [Legionella impletisoli]|uniref:Protein kinase domain-containing protein n=1 Tax=Legionella impletisoli TaxID=343510 RepID=A0A917N9C0_9GAMM|nr:protein kinase [Legionella impletisoli]GGI79306.1 hypothetical protein GCM10007966_04790 [Legionella impletisoli]
MGKSKLLPPNPHTFFVRKESRKQLCQKNSKFSIISEEAPYLRNFFIEHQDKKNYPAGSFGKVKKGFLHETGEPKYAIKIYQTSSRKQNDIRLALRAAYCYRLLGREAFTFRNHNKQYLVTEWLNGASLDNADPKLLHTIPIACRIVMAISLLRELNVFHQLGLIHNDIKPGNVMIDKNRLSFVDLDSVRPKGKRLDNTPVIYSHRFLPNAELSFHAFLKLPELDRMFDEQSDIYAMGLTLIYLFPEIYQLEKKNEYINMKEFFDVPYLFKTYLRKHGPQYDHWPKLQSLLKEMVSINKSSSLTVNELIERFKNILFGCENYHQFLKYDRPIQLSAEQIAIEGKAAYQDIEHIISEWLSNDHKAAPMEPINPGSRYKA